MTELGQRLKEARSDKGLSIEEIQSITKIQKRYLHAIEEGNYELLPGNFYTRAFIKNYAEAVGLGGEELLEEYASEIPKASTDVPENLPPRKMRRPASPSKTTSKWSSVFPSILVVLVLVGVAAIIWYVVQNGDEKTNQTATTNQVEEQVSSDENSGDAPSSDEVSDSKKPEESSDQPDGEAKDQPSEEDKKSEEKSEEKPEEEPEMAIKKVKSNSSSSTYELSNTDKYEVKLEAKGGSWVALTGASDKRYVYKSLKKGEKVTHDLTSESSASLRLGSSPNITVFVNGEKIDIPNEPVVQNVTLNFKKSE
ncbi:helix-turn-helix domain-containing protein [Pseudalkalibacillus hwajinpoensis]|uniref:Helix-turn-helix domain-containing protein n=1 Tax=Guptibacillus hwajinpoensis TaxID=208199 RepID=A0A4U1ML43_9BACL|nr:RodZ domain-containing protein [Pseudalkalibacillus hwajinpoensis]TKD71627.1 helix-turn-helix domain-containing protein [Pseudalkalibacillus hwajinpoensis]